MILRWLVLQQVTTRLLVLMGAGGGVSRKGLHGTEGVGESQAVLRGGVGRRWSLLFPRSQCTAGLRPGGRFAERQVPDESGLRLVLPSLSESLRRTQLWNVFASILQNNALPFTESWTHPQN